MTYKNKFSNLIAGLMLSFMFLIIFSSALDESAIMDELAHIPAGYSYVSLKDMRLNPEHPPLLKDLSGLALIPLNPSFPTDTKAWALDINGQWDQGATFLYQSGNDADSIISFSRLPIMLLAVLFGGLFFIWVRSVYGNKIALLALFFYVLSPTFLTHARYVTTDLGAAFGFFIGIASFIRFLEKPNKTRILLAGVAFGVAELLKFSLFLLVPIYAILAIFWVFLEEQERTYENSRREKILSFLKNLGMVLAKTIVIGLIGIAIIWSVYIWHVWNYPEARQLYDAQEILTSFRLRPIVNFDLWLISHRLTRPIGQYLLGLLMVIQRSSGGNTTFFLGEVSASGWASYFPIAYLLKETLAFHILTLLALLLAARNVISAGIRSVSQRKAAIFSWLKENFVLTASIFFIIFYWAYSIKSPLNIGVRHVLPTFPFIYLLVSRQIVLWVSRPVVKEPGNLGEWIKFLYRRFLEPIPKVILISLLMLWAAASIAISYPYYLSYYNELVGIKDGYKYITDSNYDWGQDLKRLKDEKEKLGISKIYIDYFGGGSPAYYFGDTYMPWQSSKGPLPSGSYFAISATFLQGASGKTVPGFVRKPEDSYNWLRGLEPIARGGTSIFIYKIP